MWPSKSPLTTFGFLSPHMETITLILIKLCMLSTYRSVQYTVDVRYIGYPPLCFFKRKKLGRNSSTESMWMPACIHSTGVFKRHLVRPWDVMTHKWSHCPTLLGTKDDAQSRLRKTRTKRQDSGTPLTFRVRFHVSLSLKRVLMSREFQSP